MGRDSVKPIEKLIGPGVNDVEVLVTGAGGSIGKGSEFAGEGERSCSFEGHCPVTWRRPGGSD